VTSRFFIGALSCAVRVLTSEVVLVVVVVAVAAAVIFIIVVVFSQWSIVSEHSLYQERLFFR
jgi:membrane-anchored protein YejM (alkaline phosphatase superfamily)